jgi:hypothetical protein
MRASAQRKRVVKICCAPGHERTFTRAAYATLMLLFISFQLLRFISHFTLFS